MIIHESPCMSMIIMNNVVEIREIWRFLKSWGISQVTMGFNTKSWSKLDDWKPSIRCPASAPDFHGPATAATARIPRPSRDGLEMDQV